MISGITPWMAQFHQLSTTLCLDILLISGQNIITLECKFLYIFSKKIVMIQSKHDSNWPTIKICILYNKWKTCTLFLSGEAWCGLVLACLEPRAQIACICAQLKNGHQTMSRRGPEHAGSTWALVSYGQGWWMVTLCTPWHLLTYLRTTFLQFCQYSIW